MFSLSCSEYVIPTYSQMTLRGKDVTLRYSYRKSVWLCSLESHCRTCWRTEGWSSHKAVLVIQHTRDRLMPIHLNIIRAGHVPSPMCLPSAYSTWYHGTCFFPWDPCLCTARVASLPGPAQLSVAISTEKQERARYLFSREWRRDRKKGFKVAGYCSMRAARA